MSRVYSDAEIALFQTVGGTHIAQGQDGYWNFGWINFDNRTDEQLQQHDDFVKTLQPFKIEGPLNDTDKADLTKFWRHPKVVSALGFEYGGTHQLTGSCVGAGGGNPVGCGQPLAVLLHLLPAQQLGPERRLIACGLGTQSGAPQNAADELVPRNLHAPGSVFLSDLKIDGAACNGIRAAGI